MYKTRIFFKDLWPIISFQFVTIHIHTHTNIIQLMTWFSFKYVNLFFVSSKEKKHFCIILNESLCGNDVKILNVFHWSMIYINNSRMVQPPLNIFSYYHRRVLYFFFFVEALDTRKLQVFFSSFYLINKVQRVSLFGWCTWPSGECEEDMSKGFLKDIILYTSSRPSHIYA